MSQTNAIRVIHPYRWNGMWVFDDPDVGLVREPFVAGVPEIIDHVVRDIPNAGMGYQLIKTIRADLLAARPMASLYHAYKKVLQEWASYGVTTWSSSVEPLITLPVFREMDRRGEMPIRFGFSHSVGVTALPSAPQFYAPRRRRGHGQRALLADRRRRLSRRRQRQSRRFSVDAVHDAGGAARGQVARDV
jgi:hypothetical protein